MSDQMRVSRRDFLLLSTGVLAGAGFSGCRKGGDASKNAPISEQTSGPPKDPQFTLTFKEYPTLRESDAGVQLEASPEHPALLVIRAGTDIYAFANLCAHAACNLLYEPNGRIIYCDPACGHGSVYTVEGEVTRGPATRSLYRFPAELDAAKGTVTVTLKVMA